MSPRRLIPVLLVLAGVCVALTAGVLGTRALLEQRPAAAADDRDEPGPAAVLADWDTERSRAWASGDVEALTALYVPGSRAGAADVRLLGDYLDRGMTVTALQTQVLALEVRDHSEDHLDMVVTDRLVGGEAVGEGTRQSLPRDRPSTRRIVMRRVEGRWLVDVVQDQPSAAASTSVTSSSRKS